MLPSKQQVKELQAELVSNWLRLIEEGVYVTGGMHSYGVRTNEDFWVPDGDGVCLIGGDLLNSHCSGWMTYIDDFAAKHELDVEWATDFTDGTNQWHLEEEDIDPVRDLYFPDAEAWHAGREAAREARKAIGLD